MRLWLLRPVGYDEENHVALEVGPWDPWYNKAFGFVVRAETEEAARRLAGADAGNERDVAWTDRACSTCVPLEPEGPAGVVIRDFASA